MLPMDVVRETELVLTGHALRLGVNVLEYVLVTAADVVATIVAVIVSCVFGRAPATELQIPKMFESDAAFQGQKDTAQRRAASPKVNPLVVFVRQRQLTSCVSEHDPGGYSDIIKASTQHQAQSGITWRRDVAAGLWYIIEVWARHIETKERTMATARWAKKKGILRRPYKSGQLNSKIESSLNIKGRSRRNGTVVARSCWPEPYPHCVFEDIALPWSESGTG